METLKRLGKLILIFTIITLFIMVVSFALYLIYDKNSYWGIIILLAILSSVIYIYMEL